MQQHTQDTYYRIGVVRSPEPALPRPNSQPVFFFDGEFRTWAQVQQRAQVIKGMAAYMARYR